MSASTAKHAGYRLRVLIVVAVLAGLFGMLVFRLVQLQVVRVNTVQTFSSAKVIYVRCGQPKFLLTVGSLLIVEARRSLFQPPSLLCGQIRSS